MKEKKEGIISLALLGLSPIFVGVLLTTLISLCIDSSDMGYFGDLLRSVIPTELFAAIYMAGLGPLSLCCLLVCFKAGRYSKKQGLNNKEAWLCTLGPMAFFVVMMIIQLGFLHKYLPYIGPISQLFFSPLISVSSTVIAMVSRYTGGSAGFTLLPVYILTAAMACACFYCGRKSREDAQEGLWFIPLGSLIFGFLSRALTGPDALGEIFSGLYTLSFLAFAYIIIMMCFKALKK